MGGAVLLVACAQAPKPLYLWEDFPRQQYDTLLHQGASPESQIQAMELHATKAQSVHAALPPGFRAHLGMLYLSVGNSDKARELWQTEKSTFPESSPYIDRLLQKLDDGKQKADKSSENPA
ncbi:MAG: DUF4810 domain-containing protein [Proteobacteria bacterium]|nr:DUF4810 domain-containing protein [Pseudomonadota bacterium]